MNQDFLHSLEQKATLCRLNVSRMMRASGHGHIGGAFSSMDIVTALYFYKMKVWPEDPDRADRDRFLLSAGHKSMVQYAVLAEMGFFPKELLDTYGSLHSRLPGHPNMHKLPGVEANTGALGHGLAIAAGMAMGLRLDGKPSQVYTILGDGELAEGSNWEAAAAAAHHKVDNLTAFVDFNGLQISGKVTEVMNFTPIDEKFRAFGWAVREIDGNDMTQIVETLDALPFEPGKPSMIVARTVKSKGLKQGEGNPAFHYWNASPEECDALDRDLISMLDEKEE
ncbi:hypothetical protein C805_00283 [Eubacterium sp. 14-2]|uniref:transketolase n=1 Tax=Eubacterium sp. 14-2 TaxID=1235790 RepID=UPI00033B27F2|nr:transketolase [Eubacterium sp. 14-2]EOT28762.1 hypothetical protein C805_00283 [Eubacterium sp. 14-2]